MFCNVVEPQACKGRLLGVCVVCECVQQTYSVVLGPSPNMEIGVFTSLVNKKFNSPPQRKKVPQASIGIETIPCTAPQHALASAHAPETAFRACLHSCVSVSVAQAHSRCPLSGLSPTAVRGPARRAAAPATTHSAANAYA